VIVAIWSGLLTRPAAEDAATPDIVNTYEAAMGRAEKKDEHWAQKYRLPSKLLFVELLVGTIGTLIWAYGDLIIG